MTKPTIALADLVEKGADADLLRDMIQHVVERVMAYDVENLCQAGYGERSPERANRRNGYRERLGETRAGSIPVQIPKLRTGSYFPAVPGAPADGREGPGGGDPRGLRAGGVDPLGRRAGQGHGHDRDLEEPGQPAVRRDRRPGPCVP
jgi:hypothetical protein